MSALPTDEIYEKYLQKAISEVNELGREIDAEANGRVPVLGSGHPLADVLLLKYRPQPSEVQEGVAFYGRSGQAILKSLQRLRVDPMAVYGTNCLKFADSTAEESAPWLARELHVVGPKLVVCMGEEALGFLNGLDFPLARPLEPLEGELQALYRYRGGADHARHRRLARRAAREDPLLERVQDARPLVGRAPALLTPPRAAAFGALALGLGLYYAFHESLWNASTWADTAVIALVLMPAVFGLVLLVLPLYRARPLQLFLLAVALALLAVVFNLAGLEALSNFAKLGAMTMLGFWFLNSFESVSWVVLIAVHHPVGRRVLGLLRPDEDDHREARPRVHDALVRVPRAGRERGREPRAARPALLRALPGRRGAVRGFASTGRGSRSSLSFGATMALAILTDQNGLPALPLLAVAFLGANADLLWRRLRSARRAEAQPAK